MKRHLFGAGTIALLLFIFSSGVAFGQNVVANGNFDLEDRGPWELTGENTGAKALQFDVNGDINPSWCWKRQPGTKSPVSGNGGLKQTIYLVAGQTYNFSAKVAFYVTC
jgi:hypothetical protein